MERDKLLEGGPVGTGPVVVFPALVPQASKRAAVRARFPVCLSVWCELRGVDERKSPRILFMLDLLLNHEKTKKTCARLIPKDTIVALVGAL